jgi:CRP/FNR family transcriptional regulator, cyclic AMP receptor protein
MFDRASRRGRVVRMIDEDAELFAGIPEPARRAVGARAIAPLIELERGPWDAGANGAATGGSIGLLVLDGMLLHSVRVGTEPRSELLGAGDVIRPWDGGDGESVPFQTSWEVVQPARIAVLDGRFAVLAGRWPQLTAALIARATRRARGLALQLAVTDLRRVDERLMLFFWQMADRWGRVRPDGVLVPLPVTHDVLARLVGVQRPTVTSALRRLSDAGRLHRLPDKTWLLDPRPSGLTRPDQSRGNGRGTAVAPRSIHPSAARSPAAGRMRPRRSRIASPSRWA